MNTDIDLHETARICRKARIDDLTGRTFGLLNVEKMMDEREARYALYRCLCVCGNIVYVNSKKLKRGTVIGCEDCVQPKLRRTTIRIGERFGDLSVIKMVGASMRGRGVIWLCRCICGEEIERTTKQLRNNHNICKGNHQEHAYFVDLKGRKIHQLTVLEKLDKRDSKGSVMWRCICDCGKECEYSADMLVHGKLVSCGCYRQTFKTGEQLLAGLHHVDGTCVEFLQRKKRNDNTSGHTGVYRTKNGKWKASITLKGVCYNLGTYSEISEAIQARLSGEEMHRDFLNQYYEEHPEEKGRRNRRKGR